RIPIAKLAAAQAFIKQTSGQKTSAPQLSDINLLDNANPSFPKASPSPTPQNSPAGQWPGGHDSWSSPSQSQSQSQSQSW
ncbi:hypothetical protein B484DRAFT_404790, partial [Ochromonadaceae sp. CCMP2298]